MDDPWILNMDPKKLRQIQLMLDDETTRNTFVDTLPPEIYNWEVERLMENEGCWTGMTRGKWLLRYLDSRGGHVSDLIYWFNEGNIQKALLLLKEDEPLQIVQQPPPSVTVHQGAELRISCEASSFPNPEYQWLKGKEELLLQQESVLLIQSVRKEDAGIYVCYAYKKNIATNDYVSLSFNPVEVTVLPRELPAFPDSGKKVQETNPSACFLTECQKLVSCQKDPPNQNIVTKSSPNTEKILIKKHPYSPGKVAQGTKLWFNCFATARHPVKYQWYQNREKMAGEESDKLLISELYPDCETGCMKFEYFCEIYNDYHRTFSRTAVVELEKANDKTSYVAEDKLAFLIANDEYDAYREHLVTPAVDVVDLTKLLKSIDFKVVALRNLSLKEIKKAFQSFCKLLKPESYVKNWVKYMKHL